MVFISSDAAAILPLAYTFAARDAGKHAFPVTLNTAGLQSITASDGTRTVVRTNIVVAGTSPTAVLRPDPADPAKTALVVIGTSRNDLIEVSPTNAAGTQVEVRVNSASLGSTFAPTGHLLIYGLNGNDTIQLVAGVGSLAGVKVNVPAVIDAGLGNDNVDAAGLAGNAIVLGRDGLDNLTGGSGRDLLIGGRGKDLLRGGAGEDIVSAGSTTLDTDLTGLLALMAEWGDTGTDFVTRVQHLSGTPGGANGLVRPDTRDGAERHLERPALRRRRPRLVPVHRQRSDSGQDPGRGGRRSVDRTVARFASRERQRPEWVLRSAHSGR